MGAYIDRDELLELYANTDDLDISDYDVKVAVIRQNILDMPTIDIVKCGECKFMSEHYDTDGNVSYWTCSKWYSGTDIDGYCYLGERRADE